MTENHKEETERSDYSQLSISRVQFCSSSGYLLRSIIHAAVVVILETCDGGMFKSRHCFGILCKVRVDS